MAFGLALLAAIIGIGADKHAVSGVIQHHFVEVRKAQNVIVFKRSMNTGYAGVQNPLFFKENTHMLFGDAKASVDAILKAL